MKRLNRWIKFQIRQYIFRKIKRKESYTKSKMKSMGIYYDSINLRNVTKAENDENKSWLSKNMIN